MTFDEIIQKIDPVIYRNLRTGIELGKWPDGRVLTRDQKEVCMEAVIYYENKTNIAEADRIGYINTAKVEKTPCSSSAKPSANKVDAINID